MQGSQKHYYGWYIAIALAITETISWGIIFYAFSVFITPMENDLGWSRSQLTGGFSVMLLMTAVMAFPVGAWIDKYGARLLMTLGSSGASLLIIAWSQVTHVLEFYLVWGMLGVCAAAVLYEPAFTVIATWFVRRRGIALAIVTFAAGLASTIFIPLSDALLGWLGWRDAVLTLGVLLGVTTIPLHALVLRRHPHDLGLTRDDQTPLDTETKKQTFDFSLGDALRSRYFWLMTLAFSLSYFSVAALRVHFIPYLIGAGFNASLAALASGSIGILQVTGRVLYAPLEQRFSIYWMVVTVFALQAVGISILLVNSSLLAIALFILIFGTSYGARTLARPSILADQFGASHYGRISSIMSIFLTIASTIAPFSAGLLYDISGSYAPMLWSVFIFAVLATVVVIRIPKD